MADKRQFLDIWIVESNVVYREVPFTVVCDWLQQGRLLEDDNVRRAGTADWKRIGGLPSLAAFLPKAEPLRPDDQAEALEPVEFDFGWKKKPSESEDDDVDMIPLIDVSLVLLIFFMLTASGIAASTLVNLAGVKAPPVTDTAGISVNMVVEKQGTKRTIVYAIGEDGRPSPNADDRDILKRETVIRLLNERLEKKTAPVDITINPDRDLEDGEMVGMLRALKTIPNRRKIAHVYNGVTEK